MNDNGRYRPFWPVGVAIVLMGIAFFVLAIILSAGTSHGFDLQKLRETAERKLGQSPTAPAANKGWPDSVLNGYVNDAIVFISEVGLCNERESRIEITAGDWEYDMPSDFIKVKGMTLHSTGPSVELTRSAHGITSAVTADLGGESGATEFGPTQYEDRGPALKEIRLAPMPQIKDSLVVSYYAYGTSVSVDADTLNLPQAFQLAIPDFVASEAWSGTRSEDPYWLKFERKMSLLVPTLVTETEAKGEASQP